MTTDREPIRRSQLPPIPPPEWEFSTVIGARGDSGCTLLPSDTGPVVIRRRVTWGDWEPARPDHWATEPERDEDAPRPVADIPDDLREPDNPAATALAQHIADHEMSTIQAAFRLLGMQLTLELRNIAGDHHDRH